LWIKLWEALAEAVSSEVVDGNDRFLSSVACTVGIGALPHRWDGANRRTFKDALSLDVPDVDEKLVDKLIVVEMHKALADIEKDLQG
jgi:hypothetical protein